MGYTQEELAEEMCVPKSTISAYENDKVDIKGSVIMELCGYLVIRYREGDCNEKVYIKGDGNATPVTPKEIM